MSKHYILLALSFMLPNTLLAQCDDLRGDTSVIRNWQQEYHQYFRDVPNSRLIEADSILIFFLSNPDNQGNYGMPCSYFLAEEFAQKELEEAIKRLYQNLDNEDSLNFSEAQKSWSIYYRSEQDFLTGAYMGYANFSKYGQGREIMIDRAARYYELIKERILAIEDYIFNTSK